jgi:ribosomal protein S18 acetylase RimI-like enzyme
MSIQIFTVMNEEHLRSLSDSGDIAAVCESIDNLIRQLPSSAPKVTPETIKAFFNHCGVLVVALSAARRIVGMGTLVLTYKVTDITARIEHVVVDKEFRGQKISPRIIEGLIEASFVQQVRYTDLTTGPDRLAANALYLKMGFRPRSATSYRLMGRT